MESRSRQVVTAVVYRLQLLDHIVCDLARPSGHDPSGHEVKRASCTNQEEEEELTNEALTL